MVFGDLELNCLEWWHTLTKQNLTFWCRMQLPRDPTERKSPVGQLVYILLESELGKKGTHILAKERKNSLGDHFHYIKYFSKSA